MFSIFSIDTIRDIHGEKFIKKTVLHPKTSAKLHSVNFYCAELYNIKRSLHSKNLRLVLHKFGHRCSLVSPFINILNRY